MKRLYGSRTGTETIIMNGNWNNTSLYMICNRNARGQSVYKSDTNRMDVLQLLGFMVRQQIKGALSLCLA